MKTLVELKKAEARISKQIEILERKIFLAIVKKKDTLFLEDELYEKCRMQNVIKDRIDLF